MPPELSSLCVGVDVIGNGGFNGFSVGSIDNIDLFSIQKVVKRGNRSDSLSLHELGGIGRGVADDLEKDSIGVLFRQFFKFRGNDFAGSAPSGAVVNNDQ